MSSAEAPDRHLRSHKAPTTCCRASNATRRSLDEHLTQPFRYNDARGIRNYGDPVHCDKAITEESLLAKTPKKKRARKAARGEESLSTEAKANRENRHGAFLSSSQNFCRFTAEKWNTSTTRTRETLAVRRH